jgi:hypothetical protein
VIPAAAKEIRVTMGPKAWVKLFVDGQEIARKEFPGLLAKKPVDGSQVGRDEASPVGDYQAPFAFDGRIQELAIDVAAKLEIDDKPFVGSVPSGDKIPKMQVAEQSTHPYPNRDKFGGFMEIQREATG